MSFRRRDFIAGLGGAAASWPVAAWALQGDRVPRIGVFMTDDENDSEATRRHSAFTQALAGLGWADGRNMRMDLRWSELCWSESSHHQVNVGGAPPRCASAWRH